jgi:Hint domain
MMSGMARLLLAVMILMLVAACSRAGATTGATVTPAATGIASPGPDMTIEPGTSGGASPAPSAIVSVPNLERADLRYRLVDELGRPLFCDPDFHPVAHDDEAALAARQIEAIRADAATYAAIAARLGIDPSAAPTPDQIIAIYREWKMLRALSLTDVGGRFGFDYIAAAPNGETGFHVVGAIDAAGAIDVAQREPSGQPPCPICLARGTRIATPEGDRLIETMRVGMAVWTTDRTGRRVAARVVSIGATPVASSHRVVHLVLTDGRTLDVSPGHPLADGRRVGDLEAGDAVDGTTVTSATLEAYEGGATYDLLPSGATGTYWADEVLLASTLETIGP